MSSPPPASPERGDRSLRTRIERASTRARARCTLCDKFWPRCHVKLDHCRAKRVSLFPRHSASIRGGSATEYAPRWTHFVIFTPPRLLAYPTKSVESYTHIDIVCNVCSVCREYRVESARYREILSRTRNYTRASRSSEELRTSTRGARLSKRDFLLRAVFPVQHLLVLEIDFKRSLPTAKPS